MYTQEQVMKVLGASDLLKGATHKEKVRTARAVHEAIPCSVLEGDDEKTFSSQVYLAGCAIRSYRDYLKFDEHPGIRR